MKMRLMAGIAAATMMFFAAPASAQVQFTGTAQGCFGAACAPAAADLNVGLAYAGGSFNQFTDANGFLGIGGATDNLGSLTLAGIANDYNGDIFRLLVSFTAPAAVAPPGHLFNTLLTGSVSSTSTGSVFVNFDNTPLLFTSAAGDFTFQINDVSVSAGGAAQIISAQIQAAIPEPGTWAMMLLGFGAIGYSMRRRRKPLLQLA